MDELYQEAMKKGVEIVLESYINPLLQKIGDKIQKLAKDTAQKVSIDTNYAFRDYLKEAFEKCSQIKTILYRLVPKYLYDFFEVPNVQKAGGDKRKANTLDDVLSLANESHFIILRGTGGIGKSTLMKHLFLDELSQKDLIPVYLQLKDLNTMKGEWNFQGFVLEALQRLGCKLDTEKLEYALKSGCFLFLLDGYDEVLSEHSGDFFKKLGIFCDRYPENYFIISTRPRQGSDFLGGDRFTVLQTCPFDLDQSISLIKKVGYAPEIRDRFVQALKNGLYEKHKTFASNPLLLIVMLMMFDNYAEIPEKLHIFYGEAFDTMYRKHDATKEGYQRERKSGIRDYDDFRMIFASFCFISYAQGETEFSWDRLAAIFQQIKEMSFCKSDFSIEAYVDDLVEGLCVMYQEGTQYLFTHRSFQEYFTAVFLTRQRDEDMEKLSIQLVANDFGRALNDEVFHLVRGIDENRFQANIILPILCDFEKELLNESYTDAEKFTCYLENLFGGIVYSAPKFQGVLNIQWMNSMFDAWQVDGDQFILGFLSNALKDEWLFPLHVMTWASYDNRNLENTDGEFLHYLESQGYGIDIGKLYYVDMRNILGRHEALQLLRQTPTGQRIMDLVRLRGQIESRQKKRTLNLTSLMKKPQTITVDTRPYYTRQV